MELSRANVSIVATCIALLGIAGCDASAPVGGSATGSLPSVVNTASPGTAAGPTVPESRTSCPVTEDDVEAVLGVPVRPVGCTFTEDTHSVHVVRDEQGLPASRDDAEQRYDQVVDMDGGRGFLAIGDVSAQVATTSGRVGCIVTLDGFELSPQRYRDVAVALVERCLR